MSDSPLVWTGEIPLQIGVDHIDFVTPTICREGDLLVVTGLPGRLAAPLGWHAKLTHDGLYAAFARVLQAGDVNYVWRWYLGRPLSSHPVWDQDLVTLADRPPFWTLIRPALLPVSSHTDERNEDVKLDG